MSEPIQIPLNKLVLWDGNVRKTGVDAGLSELAASIAAHGVLQSLVVRKAKRGKFAVIAGQRRLLALQSLVEAGTLAADHAVSCLLVAGEANATELSLAENAVREAMHPADQFEAFRTLIDSGMGVADVAARFGVSESVVTKRLKLGRLSPAVLDAYREGRIDLEQAQAFAITDDQAAQERVLADLPAWHVNPRTIRDVLTEGEIPSTDKRVRLIGLDVYEAAGGLVRRDLFDPEGSGYVLDSALLDRLVHQRLEAVADEVRTEGWKWVEICYEFNYGDLQQFERRYPERIPLSDEQQAELDELTAAYDELVDTDNDAEIERLQEIDRRIDELTATGERWPTETLAIAGAIVSVGWQGDIRIERGLIRPEDKPAVARADDTGDGASASKLSAKLVEDLTAQKTAAVQAVLSGDSEIALAAVVHVFALKLLYPGASNLSCLQIGTCEASLEAGVAAPEQVRGISVMAEKQERWMRSLPADPADLLEWCLDQSRDTLLDLLAFLAARTVDVIQRKSDDPQGMRLQHGDLLATSLGMDMADWFTPTAAGYFSRISRDGIIQALTEAKECHPAPAWLKMKKAELAALAEKQIAGTGWLPAPVRINNPASDDAELLPEAAE